MLLFGKMYVIVDVILAEAVISRAARAIAELQIGILRIRPAAHRALVVVKLIPLLAADAGGFSSEIDGLRACPFRDAAQQLAPAEQQEAKKRHDRQRVEREGIRKDLIDKEGRVDIGQILHPHRDDHHKQHLRVREIDRKGEEHRKIDIRRRQRDRITQHMQCEAVQDRDDHVDQDVERKPAASPVLLQRAADPVVKVDRNKAQPGRSCRNEHKADKPPDLPVQDRRRIEGQIRVQHAVDKSDHPGDAACDRKIARKSRDAEIRMPIAEFVDDTHGVFHCDPPFFVVPI